ncbi:MAG TPA: hypothetical protein VIJ56_13195 [Acidimicrobiales bacterium]
MRAATAAAIAAPLAALAALAAPPAAPASAASQPLNSAAATITSSAHVGFENCNAQHITLSVIAPRHAFAPNAAVTVTVRLRNTGSTTCGTPLARHVPEAHHTLTVGPCGALPLIVRSTHGRTVYPGPAVFFCPEETGFQLAPHSTAQATASWSQTAYVGTGTGTGAGAGTAARPQQAPPGPYRLTVDGVVTVPVTLISG